MSAILLLFFPVFIMGIVGLAIWATVREKRRFDAAQVPTPAPLPEPATAPVERWMLISETGERGPFELPQLVRFQNAGIVTETTELRQQSSGEVVAASSVIGLFKVPPPPPSLPAQVIEFDTFLGHHDPVRRGKGTVMIADGCLVLNGRKRRAFAWSKEDERIPLSRVTDVVVDGRLLRFAEAGVTRIMPRLLRLSTPKAAEELAALLPKEMSQAGAQLKADNDEFARFMAGGKPWVTYAVIAINAAIYAWIGVRHGHWMQVPPGLLSDLGGNLGPFTTQGDWWRLFTAMFLHGGLIHVAMNMFAFWEAGRVSERLFGHSRYLAVYVATGLVASIASLNWKQDVVSIGASGAVFGIYGVLLAALALRKDLLPVSVTKRLRTSAMVFVVYALVNTLGKSGIDHAAHIGGLFAGMLLGAALVRPREQGIALAFVTLILAGLGVQRAIEVSEPYADERAYRQASMKLFMAESALNKKAMEIMGQIEDLGGLALSERVDRDLIPGWQELRTGLEATPRVLPRSRELYEPLLRYAQLKHESLLMLRDASLSNDQAMVALAGERLQEANRHVETLQERLRAKPAGPPGKSSSDSKVTEVVPPQLPPVDKLPIARAITAGQWQEAARDLFKTGHMKQRQSSPLVADQALAGFIDDALEELPYLGTTGQSYVLLKAARESKDITRELRLQLLNKSAEIARQANTRPSLRADGMLQTAVGLLEVGEGASAHALAMESLAVANQGDALSRADALRNLAETLADEKTINPTSLAGPVEAAVSDVQEAFFRASVEVALADMWQKNGNHDKAREWWNAAHETSQRIKPPNRQLLVKMRLARVAEALGDPTHADQLLASRQSLFNDVLAKSLMLQSLKRGDLVTMKRHFASMKPRCRSNVEPGGYAGQESVSELVNKGALADARQLAGELSACAPRFAAHAWVEIGLASVKAGDTAAAQNDLRQGTEPLRSIKDRSLDGEELMALAKSIELAHRLGDTKTYAALLSEVRQGTYRLHTGRNDPSGSIEVLVAAAISAAKSDDVKSATALLTLAYQQAEHFPKTIGNPDYRKATALGQIGTAAMTIAKASGGT